MKFKIDFKAILTDKTLLLESMEKKLILRAMIISNFRTSTAFKLNCEGSSRNLDSYRKLINKHFPCGKLEMESQWLQHLEEIKLVTKTTKDENQKSKPSSI